MAFVLFTRVNYHQQFILFGYALLWDKTIESFVWLLSPWILEAMGGICPTTIISKAIVKVFTEVNHHYLYVAY